jgi:PIN domain nuclease of toxin-antitoxin system
VILLDTCALLWLAHEQDRLGQETLKVIEDAAVVYVSAISGFEIGIKARAGKLRLPVPPHQWFDTIIQHHDLAVIGLDLDICIRATELPPVHKDPCDRFIIATALQRDLDVVTVDKRFKEYGVRVLE